MNKIEIREMLSRILDPEPEHLDVPTHAQWAELERRFATNFSSEFKYFIELMAEFSFPGEIYNVCSEGRTNGNDEIAIVYSFEMESLDWPAGLVPFYGLGNGDYLALSRIEGEKSAVYFRDRADFGVIKYSESFEEWLRKLPAFLDGKEMS
jgi:hypothetical protein